MNTRNLHLDLIKSIAIILVILGHCIQFGSGSAFYDNSLFFDNPVFKIIYSFHMPLFALVSGYFLFITVQKYDCFAIIKRRFQQLLLPVFVVFFFYYTLIALLHRNEFPLHTYFSWYFSSCYSFLWFLWITFFVSVFVSFTHRYMDDNVLIYISIILITFITPEYGSLSTYKFVYPYFIMGYLFQKHNFSEHKMWKKLNSFSGSVILLLFYAILLLFYTRDSYIYTTGIYIFSDFPRQLFIDLYRFLIGLIGSLCLILFVKKIPYKALISRNFRLLYSLGQYSSFVYIFQQLFICYIMQPMTQNISFNYLFNLLELFFILLIALFSIWILNRFKITSRLLLGKIPSKNTLA